MLTLSSISTQAMNAIDRINTWVGERVMWLNLALVALIGIDVALRYIFNYSTNWILELEWHFFALIFLLGSGYTLLADRHVRVDVYYARFAQKRKSSINLVGHLLLLLPWCTLILITAWHYTANSWYMNEGSDQPGGLPARYLIKGSIVLGFGLLMLQGISQIYKEARLLFTKEA